jgi:hypothetical protein
MLGGKRSRACGTAAVWVWASMYPSQRIKAKKEYDTDQNGKKGEHG